MKTGKQTKMADEAARGRVVLVGTCKGDQLKDWPGWYCWPIEVESPKSKVRLRAARPLRQSHTEPQRETRKVRNVRKVNLRPMKASAPPREETPSRTLRTSREAISEWLPCGADYRKRMKETA